MENIDIHTVENFYGVYLLYCTNPKYLGRTYIGYTVNPNRRINQHNKGSKAGGARRTSNRGPWDMVLIVHGFPNDIAALRFEWAWQHPHSSRRLNHVTKKKAREKVFNFCLRVLTEMLSVGPWNRLPLVIRWLKQEYVEDFLVYKIPPLHMPLCYGPVISKKIQKGSENNANFLEEIVAMCSICVQPLDNRKLICINTECNLVSHIICLSKYFMKVGEYVPIEGKCPKCDMNYLWGDVIRKFNGCYNNLDIKIDNNNGNDFYCSDSE